MRNALMLPSQQKKSSSVTAKPKSVVATLTAADKRKYKEAKKQYYLGTPVMDDASFDALEDKIRAQDPKWSGLKKTGVKVGKKSAVELPFPIPSLDKIRDSEPAKLARWTASVPGLKVVMPKIDGASFELQYKKGKPVLLATRGDGVIGKDISYFIPHINVPQVLPNKLSLTLRLEGVMSNKTFQAKWQGEFDAPRNLVSGLFNKQSVHPAVKDVQFIVLRNLDTYKSLFDGLVEAAKCGFTTVHTVLLNDDRLTSETLSELLARFKRQYDCDLDGLVIHSNQESLGHSTEKPTFAKAWKLDAHADAVKATVKSIFWRPSAHGVLVPKVVLEPVKAFGVTVKHATCNNARWLHERNIGAGSTVKIIRSGDIIPKIIEVVKPCKKPDMPDAREFGTYKWDDNGTHLVLDDKRANLDSCAAELDRCAIALGIEDVGRATCLTMVEGGIDTTLKFVLATEEQLLAAGVGKASSRKIGAQLDALRVNGRPLGTLMVASAVFGKGIGNRVLAKALNAHAPFSFHLASIGAPELTSTVGPVAAKKIGDNLPKFNKWLKASGLLVATPKKVKAKGDKLRGQRVTFTSFRDKGMEAQVVEQGGEVVPFNSQTTILVYKAGGKESSKIDKAHAKGITVLECAAFAKKYL